LEYIFHYRSALKIKVRDDLTIQKINVHSDNFVSEFTEHVSNTITFTGDLETKAKYKRLQNWLKENEVKKQNFHFTKYKNQDTPKGKEYWLAGNNWKYINKGKVLLEKNYTIFLDPPAKAALPYIDGYYICDYNAQTPVDNGYSFPIHVIQNFLANPNLGVLSGNHYYLLSSNKNYVPELKEAVLDLFNKLNMIFQIDDYALEEKLTSGAKAKSRFSKRGKEPVTTFTTTEVDLSHL
jgi:hypothetical protein